MLYQCIAFAVLSPAIVATVAIWHYHSMVRRPRTPVPHAVARSTRSVPVRAKMQFEPEQYVDRN
jgi:hypothetical protein